MGCTLLEQQMKLLGGSEHQTGQKAVLLPSTKVPCHRDDEAKPVQSSKYVRQE